MKTQLLERNSAPLQAEGKTLRGVFGAVDRLNQNNRVYPKPVYTEALQEVNPKIESRRLMGELDHPINYDEVRLSNVSHVITECKLLENGDVWGQVELLDTPAGKVAQALVAAGIPLGISSRALGATKSAREGAEVTKMKLITYDLVADPSFGHAILSESAYAGLMSQLDYKPG